MKKTENAINSVVRLLRINNGDNTISGQLRTEKLIKHTQGAVLNELGYNIQKKQRPVDY